MNMAQSEREQLMTDIRNGLYTGPTSGLARGYAQANLVVLRKKDAYDFLLFCQRNPQSCPLLDVTDVGSAIPKMMGTHADLRTDLPRYCVYRGGVLTEERTEIGELWEEDMVCFLIGCSFTFEEALLANGIPIRHQEENVNVPMYLTSIPCEQAGSFHGNMVVSMRPMSQAFAIRASLVTARFPSVHGAPVHIGDPAAIGIETIQEPDFGGRVTIKEGEVPVFWACGVTPQAAAMASKPDLMITHAPGHMYITTKKNEQLGVL
ncbi:putative hydro-lyase [Alkalihalobacillus miscanthi]|uniref:putative hydro-lyase n=1 Tax=Shouchella miscanthi TaxID=2598861 RepID=UPI0011A0DFAC